MTGGHRGPQIDFTAGAVLHRLRSGAGRGGALARAVGVKPDRLPRVVDATAGLGRDAFILASLGCAVTLIERVDAVHAALAMALESARRGPAEVAAAVDRMTLLRGDARTWLPQLAPEVVLIDPMHPARGNTALVRQEMRDLRDVVGDDADAGALIAAGLAAARRRVVVKWPVRAPLPSGLRPPSHSIAGKTTRFDVFVTG